MALSDAERLKRERAMGALLEKHGPPAHLRSEVDIALRIDDRNVEVVEIRPRWDQPEERLERPVAKATYVKRKTSGRCSGSSVTLSGIATTPHPR